VIEKWQRKRNQLLRVKGKGYKGFKKNNEGKYEYSVSKAPQFLGPTACLQSCQKSKQCKDFSEEQRQDIVEGYWEMDWNQKKVFVSNMVDSRKLIEKHHKINGLREIEL